MKNKLKIIIFSVYAFVGIVTLLMAAIQPASILFLIILILSAGCAFFSVKVSNKEALKRCTEYVCGTVVAIDRVVMFHTATYVPIVEYIVDGKVYHTRYNMGREASYYKVGDDFNLLYNPNNPNEITQDDDSVERISKIFMIVAIVLAVIFLLVCLLGFGYPYYINAGK